MLLMLLHHAACELPTTHTAATHLPRSALPLTMQFYTARAASRHFNTPWLKLSLAMHAVGV